MPKTDFKRIEQYIKNATLKIFVNGELRGTGFFITRDGYVLTAYHCVGAGTGSITLETPYDGKFSAQLEPDKSLANYDLAILKANHQPSHYLPLGYATEKNIGDEVVTIGYPASHLSQNQEVGVYKGHISRWRDDEFVELSEAIKGKGHSGGSVYHYASRRVIGVVTERYHESVMANSGLATRLDKLFNKWLELSEINQAAVQIWDKRLQTFHTNDLKHRIFFAMVPDDSNYYSLLNTLREVVEDRWGCQLLTAKDRQYRDSNLENIRCHMEQAHAFIADISSSDPEVMFVLGAVQFYLSHSPSILLAQGQPNLPKSLQGRMVIRYVGETADLANYLDSELTRIEVITQMLNDPEREHFLSISTLQTLIRLSLPEKTWQLLQERYPTKESWQQASVNTLESLLGKDADFASIILKRIGQAIP
jgi:Trypsin-like peptidase domain